MVLCTGKKEENVLPGSAKSYKGGNYQVVLLGVNVCGAECKVVFFFICSFVGVGTHQYVSHLNTWCVQYTSSLLQYVYTHSNCFK
jgi:hypothetical protein